MVVSDNITLGDGAPSDVVVRFSVDGHCRDIVRRRKRPWAAIEPDPGHDGAEDRVECQLVFIRFDHTGHLAGLLHEIWPTADQVVVVVAHGAEL